MKYLAFTLFLFYTLVAIKASAWVMFGEPESTKPARKPRDPVNVTAFLVIVMTIFVLGKYTFS